MCDTHHPSTKGLHTPGTDACDDPPLEGHSPGITTGKEKVNHT